MATIAINGVDLEPQPMDATWESFITHSNLNGTDGLGAYATFRIVAPAIAGQAFNWDTYENQVLDSLQAYAPGELYTSANVVYNTGQVSKKIVRYESPLDNSNINIELVILVIV